MRASIVLCDMERTQEASYGFRSWILQDYDEPFEIVLNLFNKKRAVFEALMHGAKPNCHCRIQSYDAPSYFNISAANNLGLARSTGEYVLFANSDIIYPPGFLRTFMNEVQRRDLSYILGSRKNLSEAKTRSLPNPTSITNYDSLIRPSDGTANGIGSPWTVKRSVAMAIGGFDPKILCHEDSEFNDRVSHYLRRTGLQGSIYGALDLFGYHLHHGASELYTVSQLSRAILEPRRERLLENPNSEEDIVPTRLDDSSSLLLDLYSTQAPPASTQSRRRIRAVKNRILGAIRHLRGGI